MLETEVKPASPSQHMTLKASRRQRALQLRVRRVLKRARRISRVVEGEMAVLRELGAPSPALITIRESLQQALTSDGAISYDRAAAAVLRAELNPPLARNGTAPTAASDLRCDGRRIAVFTTAALPWMTGTSINPLLRAAHLATAGYPTTLVLPWLEPEQQPTLFPEGLTFASPGDQASWVHRWLTSAGFDEAQLAQRLVLRWYPAIYEEFLGAIIQRSGVDVTQVVPPAERDCAILDEPEHLNWYHHGKPWNAAYSHVVGILHTNYEYYAEFEERADGTGNGAGDIPPAARARIMGALNGLVCRAYVDVTIRLSATLPEVPGKSLVCNVHGVRADFLAKGAEASTLTEAQRAEAFSGGAYFLGKCLWTKGYRELWEQLRAAQTGAQHGPVAAMEEHGAQHGVEYGAQHGAEYGGGASAHAVHVDTFGSGRDEKEIKAAAASLPSVTVHPGIDHASPELKSYRVFVNPSTSEVLCTATAEALAMGKKVVLPDHPCNQFFREFRNAAFYSERSGLLPAVRAALATPPQPLSPKELYLLSWDAATERLIDAARLTQNQPSPRTDPLTGLAYAVHHAMGLGPMDDYFRANSGATPSSGMLLPSDDHAIF